MSWARIDDAFDDHPKVLALLEQEQGGAAIGLWTLCLAWAHRNTLRKGKRPGHIPGSLPRRYLGPAARDLAGLLVKEGLWDASEDGDGWLIHDFGDYLATDKTREARSAAGRKGAASRWRGQHSNGSESVPDGKLPFDGDNEPEACHDVDSKTMASDGSRAPARRAISYEIAPVPVPVPTTSAQPSQPDGSAPGDVTAQTLVGEWIDHCRKRPPDRVIGQTSRELGQLLDEGIDPEFIRRGLAEWHRRGQHPATLASFVNAAMNASSASRASPQSESTGIRKVRQAIESGERVQRMIDEGKLNLGRP